MIDQKAISEFRFRASVEISKRGDIRILGVSFIDPRDDIKKDVKTFENIAKILTLRSIKSSDKAAILYDPESREVYGGLCVELERFEMLNEVPGYVNKTLYHFVLKASPIVSHRENKLRQRIKHLEKDNKNLRNENKELITLIEKLERIKESFRIPFDAVKDLMISFDKDGNVIVVNEASTDWFGQTPRDIVRRKCRTVLKQNVVHFIKKVTETQEAYTFEDKIGQKVLQFTYVPMQNKKTDETEVVMLAQDITQRKMLEQQRVERGRNEGVSIMGGTIRHILNSSLHAILGFAQLALSTYDWPKETMVKYLKLIERTALRMKHEISMIAEQKEYRATKYLNIPETEGINQILDVRLDRDSEN